ncbi:MAG: hypothetical protein Q9170_004693 [Blastenia crenularia]
MGARRLPCEDYPEQPHCTQLPPDPPQPTNTISSTPLTPDQVRIAFSQIEVGAFAEILQSLGEDTAGKSQADLVAAANRQFEASMGNLDLGQVIASQSFANFALGPNYWVYYDDRIKAGD